MLNISTISSYNRKARSYELGGVIAAVGSTMDLCWSYVEALKVAIATNSPLPLHLPMQVFVDIETSDREMWTAYPAEVVMAFWNMNYYARAVVGDYGKDKAVLFREEVGESSPFFLYYGCDE
ncbi:hypothetical protein PQX77_022233 [Marasmius sp. AFHP31]|nr:hypothetical protein PQX77_022233 [Marasmius sp. AFHP31]